MFDKYDLMCACEFGERILFKYNDKNYVIDMENNMYLLCDDSKKYQYFNTLHNLYENSNIEGKNLKEILNFIEIISIKFDTKKRFTVSTIMNREIEFEYNGVNYFKSSDPNGYYIYNSKDKTSQYFKSNEELLEKAVLEGIPLKELWDKIFIQCIF